MNWSLSWFKKKKKNVKTKKGTEGAVIQAGMLNWICIDGLLINLNQVRIVNPISKEEIHLLFGDDSTTNSVLKGEVATIVYEAIVSQALLNITIVNDDAT